MQRPVSRPVLMAILLANLSPLLSLPGAAVAQSAARPTTASEPLVHIQSDRSELTVIERFSKVVEFDNRITRVDGFDPEILTVTALSPTQLRVQALAPGVTTLVVTDENERIFTVEVFVIGDVRHLQAYIDRFFPKAAVRAVAVRDSVVLRGWVTKPEHITEMVEIAEQFYPTVLNQMKVGGVQQVLLKVKVIEAQRTKIRRLGMNWAFRNESNFLAVTPGMLTPLSGMSTAIGMTPSIDFNASSLADPSVTFGIVGSDAAFNGFIEALKQESLLKILAEPELVIMNGRPANLLAGGEFPIIVPAGLGTATIEWREFGTRLEAVPIILSNDTVRLELQPEVSDRDFANAVTLQGTVVPGLTTRRANTQVEMKFGQTLMIAGLISSRKTTVIDKIPFFGELPYIGAAFRRSRNDITETELIILVTPELVAPLEQHQVPPGGPGLSSETPLDREFYWYGWPEVPNYGGPCSDCGTSGYGMEVPVLPPGHVLPPGAALPPGAVMPHPESMHIAPEGMHRPPSGTPPAVVPPQPSAGPGLVVPQRETPEAEDGASGPSLPDAPSRKSASSSKKRDRWMGSRTRPATQPSRLRQVGHQSDQTPRGNTVRHAGGTWRPRSTATPVKSAAHRVQRSARPRLIEPTASRPVQSTNR